jgi:hypothetical protein
VFVIPEGNLSLLRPLLFVIPEGNLRLLLLLLLSFPKGICVCCCSCFCHSRRESAFAAASFVCHSRRESASAVALAFVIPEGNLRLLLLLLLSFPQISSGQVGRLDVKGSRGNSSKWFRIVNPILIWLAARRYSDWSYSREYEKCQKNLHNTSRYWGFQNS